MIVYQTTNLINGKIYIGQDSKGRKGYLGAGKYLLYAIKKYGKENFKKETLERCLTKEELSEREIYWIKKLSSKVPNGYNIADGGGGILGFRFSKKQKEKLSRIARNNKKMMEHIASLGRAWKGKKLTPAQCQIRSEANKNKIVSKASREKMSEAKKGIIPWNKGKTGVYLEEALKRMANSQRGVTPWNKGRRK